MSNELLGNEDTTERYQTFSLLNFKRPKGKSFWHLICILWALNRRSFQVKQSCTVKDGIATNQTRAKNTIVILSDNTVAQFKVLFANSLVETQFFLSRKRLLLFIVVDAIIKCVIVCLTM